MRASIEPVSAVPPSLLRELLLRYGLPPAIIDWKYFDKSWSPRGERGYVWTRDGRVQGMIGLIPFRVVGPGGPVDAAWTCDWYVEASVKNPGIGVLLFKEAIQRSGPLFTLGGNEATARMVPRLATHTVPEAAVVMSLPLRVGGTVSYERIERRLPLVSGLGLGELRVPRRRPKLSAPVPVTLQTGIASAVCDLIEAGGGAGWAPAYDREQLAWQFERCPAIECASVVAQNGKAASAAAICWRPRDDERQWRLALWARPDATQAAVSVVNGALREIERRRAHAVSTIVARADALGRDVFTGAGFWETDHVLPFYALGAAGPIQEGMERIGYADSDLGYRF